MSNITVKYQDPDQDILGADVMIMEEAIHDLITKVEAGQMSLSYSSIKNFALGPIQFLRYKLKDKKKTAAMTFGDLVDTIVFPRDEPGQRLWDRFVILEDMAEQARDWMPDWSDLDITEGKLNGRKNNSKAFLAQLEAKAEAEGLLIITRDQYAAAKAIRDDLWRFPDSRWIMSQLTDHQIFLEYEWRGFKWRGIPDGENPWLVMDLKMNSRMGSPSKYYWTLTDHKYRYDWQQALYTVIPQREKTSFHLVYDTQQNVPYVFEIDQRIIQGAAKALDFYMDEFERCIYQEAWMEGPGFFAPHGVFKVGL